MKNFKSKFILVFLFLVIITSFSSYATNYDNNFKLRIGIFFGAGAKSSYSISGQNLNLYYDNRKVWSTFDNNFVVTKVNSIYYSDDYYEDINEAFKFSDTVYYLDGYYYPATLKMSNFSRSSNDRNIAIADSNGRKIVLLGNQEQYISSDNDIISINGGLYREKASVYNDGKKIIAVNVVGLENYLKGVVPKEMPSSWNIEALKAQSIVARNFAITNINKYKKDGFNLCNTTNCQVYGGLNAEKQSTNFAVESTVGQLMYYNHDIVQGYFHSSSGGRTESSQNIWNINVPYLVGANDPYSTGNSHDNWVVELTSNDINLALQKNGINVGDILRIDVVYSENGRATDLTIVGSNSSYTLKKDRIRTVLGSSKFKSTYFTLESSKNDKSITYMNKIDTSRFTNVRNINDLRYNLSVILDSSENVINSNTVSGSVYIFRGKGYGHGVGMSQYGAKKMADQGFSYQDILKYYFKGIEIG